MRRKFHLAFLLGSSGSLRSCTMTLPTIALVVMAALSVTTYELMAVDISKMVRGSLAHGGFLLQ